MNQHLLSLGKEGHDDSCNDEDYKNSTQSSCNEQCFQFQIMANYQKEGGYFQYFGRKNLKSGHPFEYFPPKNLFISIQ